MVRQAEEACTGSKVRQHGLFEPTAVNRLGEISGHREAREIGREQGANIDL